MDKGLGTPYIIHPMKAAAAVLYDVVEGTEAAIDEACRLFGKRAAVFMVRESESKREGLPPTEAWRARKDDR